MPEPELTIHDLTCRSVVVPLAHPLVTRVVTIEQAPLLLIDLLTEEGVTGSSYLFGYSARGNAYLALVLRDIARVTRGDGLAPADLHAKLKKALTLMGHEGIAAMAAAGFDMAAWDALSKAAGVPLATLLGGRADRVRAYNSNGLGLITPEAAAAEAQALVTEGAFSAVKMRLGRPTLEEDLAAVRAVRGAVGESVLLPCDFNQGLSVVEAIRRGRALDHEDVYWIEEPTVYDDLQGCAKIAREVATPVQIGENFYGPKAVADAVGAHACDYMMFDLMRIGGVTGWMRAAALAEVAGIEVSSHILPEVSCHLMAATPTRHWLEYVDWACPILAEPLRVVDGHVHIPQTPGTGVAWNEDAVAKYTVDL
ncbi:MAG: mandelate racemase [Gammaproteobacteria bacterium]|nr:mandelate racemase [Gammaproteobacteria bacterium]NIR85923.1 mandelate racemase [Gammaproteobacteria bacterium]NIR91915.1 mandelate racemase [Gammaproteobacteria bacterium]NIU07172.1 mandelate racemase [Gammaproteobacteria bacterium]NIV53985.1 mandelate racemase [Gammaproteobacteria bacterium]